MTNKMTIDGLVHIEVHYGGRGASAGKYTNPRSEDSMTDRPRVRGGCKGLCKMQRTLYQNGECLMECIRCHEVYIISLAAYERLNKSGYVVDCLWKNRQLTSA